MKQNFRPRSLRNSSVVLSALACMTLVACNQRDNETATSSPPPTVSPATPAATPDAVADNTTASSTAAAGQPLSDADRDFFIAAAQSGYAEITASEMARQRSSSDLVKNFADMMVMEHTAVGNDLKTLALKKGIQLPEKDAGKYKGDLDALGKVKGVAFDRAYAERAGLAAHKDAVSLFEQTAEKAGDEDVKKFARDTLPALKRHLEMAQNLSTV